MALDFEKTTQFQVDWERLKAENSDLISLSGSMEKIISGDCPESAATSAKGLITCRLENDKSSPLLLYKFFPEKNLVVFVRVGERAELFNARGISYQKLKGETQILTNKITSWIGVSARRKWAVALSSVLLLAIFGTAAVNLGSKPKTPLLATPAVIQSTARGATDTSSNQSLTAADEQHALAASTQKQIELMTQLVQAQQEVAQLVSSQAAYAQAAQTINEANGTASSASTSNAKSQAASQAQQQAAVAAKEAEAAAFAASLAQLEAQLKDEQAALQTKQPGQATSKD